VTAPGVCGRRLVASSGGWRQCVAQALAMLGTNLVAALFACLLVALAARRVCRLAAIDGRHLLLHAALESKVLVDGGRHSVRRAACVCGRGEVA